MVPASGAGEHNSGHTSDTALTEGKPADTLSLNRPCCAGYRLGAKQLGG